MKYKEGVEGGAGEDDSDLLLVVEFFDFGAIPYTSAKEGRL
jgi:hypothetical protein